MNVAAIIADKRDGIALTREQIEFVVNGYADGSIPDYQMSALAMAILLRNMQPEETTDLTRAMLETGIVLDWNGANAGQQFSRLPKVDKHSTGGVGDKVSIILAPLLASCGVCVPMISGRGLGPTGGTLDKLESIEGFRTDLSIEEIHRVVDEVGCVITGASAEIAPADKRLYALRDVTATVESVPLITASILSKKLAEGLDSLVLDVKFGSGAFMQDLSRARELAVSLVNVGNRLGTRTTATLTDMNQPLGVMCGNANEIQESIDVLRGEGPDDVRNLTIALCADLLVSTKVAADIEAATNQLVWALDSGEALEKFHEMVRAQGGDPDRICKIAPSQAIESPEAGYVSSINARRLGMAIIELGGGRRELTDKIDFSSGLAVTVRIGDRIDAGDKLLDVQFNGTLTAELRQMILNAITISDAPCEPFELIGERIQFDSEQSE